MSFVIPTKLAAGSSNGRTTASGAVNRGSSPCPATLGNEYVCKLISFSYKAIRDEKPALRVYLPAGGQVEGSPCPANYPSFLTLLLILNS